MAKRRMYKKSEISDKFKPKVKVKTSEIILAVLGLATIILYIFSTCNMEKIQGMNIVSVILGMVLAWIILLEVWIREAGIETENRRYSLVVRDSSLIYTSSNQRTIMVLPFCIIGRMQERVISSDGKNTRREWITLNHDLKFNPNDVDKDGRTIEEFLKEVINKK